MREIKFRFAIRYYKDTGFIFEYYTLEELINGKLLDTLNLGSTIISKDEYTGLKDINGKDIFEGDFLETALGVGVVKFIYGSFILVGVNKDIYSHIRNYLIDATSLNRKGNKLRIKVIGNIHENKNLLK